MLNGISILPCAGKITASCEGQYDPAAGYENKYLGLGIEW